MENIVNFVNAKIFQKDNLILKEVNFSIDKGEFIYLVGKTGSGKSSLLQTMYADIPLKEGEASVVGFNLSKIKEKEVPYLRRKLGIVFQDFQLLTDRSVTDNLFFVMKATGWKDKKKMEKRAIEVLDKVGLSTKGYKMPHQLSGGEQQRIAIARALINDPDLILADEPTGNLDPETSQGLMDLLMEISKSGRSILMATHDYKLFEKYPSRTLKCENSQVIDIRNYTAS